MDKFVLISKDAMCTDYLPTYGNKQWKTPNIDVLAERGTVFHNHYTAAPSTVMSFYSMITGEYGHETKYEMYEKIHDVYQGETLFSKLKKRGYKCHVIWGKIWMELPKYFDCYRDDVEIHLVENFSQGVGAHYSHEGYLIPDDEKRESTFEKITTLLKEILDNDDKVFVWVHFPHVINGEVAYGSDIELYDKYIGYIRSLVPDECIAITADHGNMNGHKGKICYGFDVYQPEIRIPLIVPRIHNIENYNENTSAVDLYAILFERKIPKRKFIYSDTAYKAQKHRKLAIIYNNYKYIYNKKNGKEELYDLAFDPMEEFSIIDEYMIDPDRKIKTPMREIYYYPDWDKLFEIRKMFREEKQRIWCNGSMKYVIKNNIKDLIRPFYVRLKRTKTTAKIQK